MLMISAKYTNAKDIIAADFMTHENKKFMNAMKINILYNKSRIGTY